MTVFQTFLKAVFIFILFIFASFSTLQFFLLKNNDDFKEKFYIDQKIFSELKNIISKTETYGFITNEYLKNRQIDYLFISHYLTAQYLLAPSLLKPGTHYSHFILYNEHPENPISFDSRLTAVKNFNPMLTIYKKTSE